MWKRCAAVPHTAHRMAPGSIPSSFEVAANRFAYSAKERVASTKPALGGSSGSQPSTRSHRLCRINGSQIVTEDLADTPDEVIEDGVELRKPRCRDTAEVRVSRAHGSPGVEGFACACRDALGGRDTQDGNRAGSQDLWS